MNLKKITGTLLGMNLLQVGLVIIIWLSREQGLSEVAHFSLILVVGLALVNSLATVIGVYYGSKVKNISLLESMKDLEALNTTLRAQRHDYLNHLQIVYGLMEIEEYEEAKKYMAPVVNEVMKVSKALKTSQPAVNALLKAKFEMAERSGVDMFLEVKSNLKDIKIEAWELCKVLANIIDNSMTALGEKEGSRSLYIDIGEDESNYIFSIYNNGPMIPKEQLETIFNQGFTTKKEEGHGMGLYIVRQIIKASGGSIEVSSTLIKTCFTITLPK